MAAASGGGTINVSGTGNTITSTTGRALNIDGTTIGASDITFQSISANGAPNGILLNNTGTTGEQCSCAWLLRECALRNA